MPKEKTLDMILENICCLVIGKKGCSDCTDAINLLIQNDMCFGYCPHETHLDVLNEVKMRYGEKQSFPIIFKDKRYVGTYADLKKMIENK